MLVATTEPVIDIKDFIKLHYRMRYLSLLLLLLLASSTVAYDIPTACADGSCARFGVEGGAFVYPGIQYTEGSAFTLTFWATPLSQAGELFRVEEGGVTHIVVLPVGLALGEEQLVAVAFSGAWSMYVGGVLHSLVAPGLPTLESASIVFGDGYSGVISGVVAYKRVLQPAEIAALSLYGTVCSACPANEVSSAGAAGLAGCVCPLQDNFIQYGSHTCLCGPGFVQDLASCTACPAESYCPGMNELQSCPENTTSTVGAESLAHCLCVAGYHATEAGCVICPVDHFCPGGALGKQACDTGLRAHAGASTGGECFCAAGLYRSAAPEVFNSAGWLAAGGFHLNQSSHNWVQHSRWFDGDFLLVSNGIASSAGSFSVAFSSAVDIHTFRFWVASSDALVLDVLLVSASSARECAINQLPVGGIVETVCDLTGVTGVRFSADGGVAVVEAQAFSSSVNLGVHVCLPCLAGSYCPEGSMLECGPALFAGLSVAGRVFLRRRVLRLRTAVHCVPAGVVLRCQQCNTNSVSRRDCGREDWWCQHRQRLQVRERAGAVPGMCLQRRRRP